MTGPVLRQTDHCCPWCGDLLRVRTHPDGSLIFECGCGWSLTWRPGSQGGEQ